MLEGQARQVRKFNSLRPFGFAQDMLGVFERDIPSFGSALPP